MKYKYDWDEFPEVKKLLERIYLNTDKELNRLGNQSINALLFVSYIEDYLRAVIDFNYDFDKVVNSLEVLQYISFKESIFVNNEKVTSKYPPFMDFGNRIFLDSSVEDREMQRFYLYEALSSKVLNFKSEETLKFSKIYANVIGSYRLKASILVNNGWLLLEEALIYEIAKRFTSYSLMKVFTPNIENEYEQILVSFGLTLNNVGSVDLHSDKIVIYKLIKYAFNRDFSYEVINDYLEKGHEFELYQSLYIMGLIINNKIKRFPNIKLDEKEIKDMTLGLFSILSRLFNFEEKDMIVEKEIVAKNLNNDGKRKLLMLVRNDEMVKKSRIF